MTTPYIAETASINEYRVAHENQTAAYDADDLLHELCEIGGPLLFAVRAKDAALIGRLVLAVVAAQIERRACYECEQESLGIFADQAAAEIMRVQYLEIRNTMFAIANSRPEADLFTDAPLTNFGGAL